MLSILVCHSYFLRLDQKQTARAKPYPTLARLRVVARKELKSRGLLYRSLAGKALAAKMEAGRG